jgi:type I restriction-modification system DNA methylase subunit
MNNMPNYKCELCENDSSQISHHKTHLTTKSHKQAKTIKKLELEKLSEEELQEKYNKIDINDILKDMETMKQSKRVVIKKTEGEIMDHISSREALKDKIHRIHNYLRNKGAGYGMSALKVFNVLYGLNRIEKYELFEATGLREECRFSNLLAMANSKEALANEELAGFITGNKETDLLALLLDNSNVADMLYYDIPRKIKSEALAFVIKEIDDISKIEEKFNVQLSGKVYEYFIGRDDTAISELGAYFTDRHITNFVYNVLLKPEPKEDGTVHSMADMFGGSGGFTVGYANYLKEHYNKEVDWKSCVNNIYHYDMNEDVNKSAALELFCITREFPNMEKNIKTQNSFTENIIDSEKNLPRKFHYIVTNPPYGGDKSSKTDKMIKRDKVINFIKEELVKEDTYSEEQLKHFEKQMKGLQKDNKDDKAELDSHKVTIDKSSTRIQKLAAKYGISGNDKECVSLVLMMDCLEEGGTAIGVLKEGVFFNKSYKTLREALLLNYNVRKVISIPSDQFENTSTKTSIIVFDNTEEKTSVVEFSELKVDKYEEDIIELVEGKFKLMECKDEIKTDGVYEEYIASASIEEILETTTNSLNGKDYNKRVIVPGEGYELVKLGDICDITYGTRITKKNNVNGNIPVFGGGDITFYTNKTNRTKNTLVISRFALSKCCVRLINSEFYLNDSGLSIHSKNIKLQKYINYYFIDRNIQNYIYNSFTNGSIQKNLDMNKFPNFEIPIPKSPTKIKEWTDKISAPYEEKNMKELRVEELEKEVQERIKHITENEECEEVELEKLCEIKYGTRITKNKNKIDDPSQGFPVYGGGDITFYTKDFNRSGKTLIISRFALSKCCVRVVFGEIFLNDSALSLHCKYQNFINHYMLNLQEEIIKQTAGSVQKNLDMDSFRKFKINLPKNKQLITELEPLFQEIEQLQKEVKNADDLFNQYIQELGDEAIKK